LKYYPNPVKDILTVSADKKVDQISVYNLAGQLLQENNHSNVINLSKLPSGVYFVKTTIEGQMDVTKVIKE